VGLPALGQALEIMRDIDDRAGVALCQLPLGFVEAAAGNAEAAEERYRESVKFFKESGDEWGAAISMNAYAWMSLGADIDIGSEIFEEAVALSKRLGTTFEYGMALRDLGGYRARHGSLAEAKILLADALRTLWHGSARGGSSYTVDAIAEVATEGGALTVAATLFGATDAIRKAIGSAIIPMFEGRFQRYVDRVKTELGEDEFSKAWATGVELTMDETVELALEWIAGTKAPGAAEVAPRSS
jgi:hypothetical protein